MILEIDDNMKKINNQWKNFIMRKPVDSNIIRSIILDSWNRCKKYGIDPNMTEYNNILSQEELEERLKKNSELIDTAWPILETLINYYNIKNTNFRVDLFDEDVYLLKTKGSSTIIEASQRFKSLPGVSKREEHSGTNAIGLAYLLKEPVLVVGAEHYISLFHHLSCAAAPIKNSKGKIIGFVNTTGFKESIHPHTLGMVISIVKAIEHNLKLREMAKELSVQNNLLESIVETVEKGVMVINRSGKIQKISKIGRDLLGISQAELKNILIQELFEIREPLSNFFKNRKMSLHRELTLKYGNNAKNLYVEIKPLKTECESNLALMMFRELGSMQHLAKRFGTSGARFFFHDIIGAEKSLKNVVEIAKRAAVSRIKVLLEGESGTGKELFAHAIHNDSRYRKGPFVNLNCAAIPTELIESELFGYEEGAFTGARKGGMMGKIEMADEGTLFLDEINSMSLNLQGKLLRVLQTNSFMRLGGQKELQVNVRIIAASNKDLKEEIRKGRFREDLYYRLNVVLIYIPPLRERKEDMQDLIEYFIKKYNELYQSSFVPTKEFIEIIKTYNWPGNVRELENVIERAIAISPGNLLTAQSLPDEIKIIQPRKNLDKVPNISNITHHQLEEIEINHLVNILKDTNGNIAETARILGISRNTVYRKMKKYNIQ